MAARRKGTMEDDLVGDGFVGDDVGVDLSFSFCKSKEASKARTLRDERVSPMVEDGASSFLPMVMSLGGCGVVPLGDGRPGMSKPDDVSCRNEKNINK